jgi:formamidopyrimidine-DNA glycosylase
VCIFTARISDVNTETEPTIITVEVLDVEFLQQAGENPTEIDEMMEHLDEARQRRQEQRANETCDNCASIESDTRLSVERKQGGRDLHYCAQCSRLLSTEEYQEWIEIHD